MPKNRAIALTLLCLLAAIANAPGVDLFGTHEGVATGVSVVPEPASVAEPRDVAIETGPAIAHGVDQTALAPETPDVAVFGAGERDRSPHGSPATEVADAPSIAVADVPALRVALAAHRRGGLGSTGTGGGSSSTAPAGTTPGGSSSDGNAPGSANPADDNSQPGKPPSGRDSTLQPEEPSTGESGNAGPGDVTPPTTESPGATTPVDEIPPEGSGGDSSSQPPYAPNEPEVVPAQPGNDPQDNSPQDNSGDKPTEPVLPPHPWHPPIDDTRPVVTVPEPSTLGLLGIGLAGLLATRRRRRALTR